MSQQQINLKTVYELRVDSSDDPIRYCIPAYQRGYRWSTTQVTQLLEDIREFTQRENPQPDEFYCLQPLVLRVNEDGSYEVVDGQQRLTTLLLVLRYFNERLSAEFREKIYSLEYETRPNLSGFLDNPDEAQASSNIDFYHIAEAARTIREWFKKRPNEVEKIKDALLNQTKIIWFQLSKQENAVAAFTRLNVGKIPLTNGELIRALFLKRAKGEKAEALQLRIAYEWDLLEKTLQNGDFWGFVSNDIGKQGARIDFLFELVAQQEGLLPSADDYATFNHFSAKLSAKNADREEAWLAIKRNFMLLEEWFQDRHLYHLVGFLIWDGMDVNDLRQMAEGTTKDIFKERLRITIRDRALGTGAPTEPGKLQDWLSEQVDNLQYPSSSSRIRSVLLLFNIATLLENSESNMRFQFENFKAARWDIEHVRSVTSDRPNSDKGQIEWLNHCRAYFQQTKDTADLQKEIQDSLALRTKEARQANFDILYEKVLAHFHEANEEGPNNGIDNLALLDDTTNRSYKNAVFAVKRHRILSLDRHGTFVPLCTRNVFLKCYNPQVDHVMFWTEEDGEGYRGVLIDTLHRFFIGGRTE